MQVTTGYGYYTKNGQITAKYHLPMGQHPDPHGYEFVECATKEEWDAVQVWQPTPSALELFNPSLAIAREAQAFSALDMVRFAPISYNINELIRFKNFWGGVTTENVPYVGLKQFCQAAINAGNGMFTQNDYDRLNGILKEQGIDLDNQG